MSSVSIQKTHISFFLKYITWRSIRGNRKVPAHRTLHSESGIDTHSPTTNYNARGIEFCFCLLVGWDDRYFLVRMCATSKKREAAVPWRWQECPPSFEETHSLLARWKETCSLQCKLWSWSQPTVGSFGWLYVHSLSPWWTTLSKEALQTILWKNLKENLPMTIGKGWF